MNPKIVSLNAVTHSLLANVEYVFSPVALKARCEPIIRVVDKQTPF